MRYRDRLAAGQQLAEQLGRYATRPDVLGLVLPRGGVQVLNEDAVHCLQIPVTVIDAVVAQEQQELERRTRHYRRDRLPLDMQEDTVILVDDGLTTGVTMHAAVPARDAEVCNLLGQAAHRPVALSHTE